MYYLPYIIATEQPVPHITGNADFNIMSLPLNPFREFRYVARFFYLRFFRFVFSVRFTAAETETRYNNTIYYYCTSTHAACPPAPAAPVMHRLGMSYDPTYYYYYAEVIVEHLVGGGGGAGGDGHGKIVRMQAERFYFLI